MNKKEIKLIPIIDCRELPHGEEGNKIQEWFAEGDYSTHYDNCVIQLYEEKYDNPFIKWFEETYDYKFDRTKINYIATLGT